MARVPSHDEEDTVRDTNNRCCPCCGKVLKSKEDTCSHCAAPLKIPTLDQAQQVRPSHDEEDRARADNPHGMCPRCSKPMQQVEAPCPDGKSGCATLHIRWLCPACGWPAEPVKGQAGASPLAPEARFTIVFSPQADGSPTRVQFVPQARGVSMSPRDIIAMCAEGIRWALAEDMKLAQEAEKRERTGLWLPSGVRAGEG